MIEIRASEHVDPDGLIVRSGERLARRTIEALGKNETVSIDLRGLSGISSSYFNIFLALIREELGLEALERVRIHFVSSLQKQVFDRSRDAVVQSANVTGQRKSV